MRRASDGRQTVVSSHKETMCCPKCVTVPGLHDGFSEYSEHFTQTIDHVHIETGHWMCHSGTAAAEKVIQTVSVAVVLISRAKFLLFNTHTHAHTHNTHTQRRKREGEREAGKGFCQGTPICLLKRNKAANLKIWSLKIEQDAPEQNVTCKLIILIRNNAKLYTYRT